MKGETQCTLNHKAITEDAKKDGFFGIITNVKEMSASRDRFQLQRIVADRGCLWGNEGHPEKPLNVPLDRSTHYWPFNASFLSHFCEAYLTKRLRMAGMIQNSKASENKIIKERPLTVKSAMDELNQVMAVPVRIKKETIWIRTDIPPNAVKLLRAIGMQIPPKIIPQKHKM